RSWSLALAALSAAWLAGAPPAEAGRPLNQIAEVAAKDDGAAATIRVRGSIAPRFTAYVLERPRRVVVDVAGARLAGGLAADDAATTRQVNGWAVNHVTI